MTSDPIARFLALWAKAQAVEPHDATAVTLATADEHGRPSARLVLLKSVDPRGFVFFTNRESRKGREIEANPFAALCIHWPASQQQVRVEGRLERTSDAESDAYFASRHRESQLGAWASRQSEPLGSREELLARVREFEALYPHAVPRPPHWGGYRLVPDRIELWFAGPARLHDRFVFERAGARGAPAEAGSGALLPAADAWEMTQLYP